MQQVWQESCKACPSACITPRGFTTEPDQQHVSEYRPKGNHAELGNLVQPEQFDRFELTFQRH